MSDSHTSIDWGQLWGSLMKVFFAAGVLCFFSGLVLSCQGHRVIRQSIDPSGGVIGPITIRKVKTPCRLKVAQILPYGGANKWSWVQFELLDSDKEALFGLGDEVWEEQGYDSDGPWQERKGAYSANFIIRDPGTYYLQATTERSSPQINDPIQVRLRVGTASSVPLTWGGIIFLILGVISFIQYGKRTQLIRVVQDPGSPTSYRTREDDFNVLDDDSW